MSNKVYLLKFNNGECHDDNWEVTLCALLDEQRAKGLISELSEWLEIKRKEMPVCYLSTPEYIQGHLNEDRIEEYELRQSEWFALLEAPHEFDTLLSGISRFGHHSGYLKLEAVKLFEDEIEQTEHIPLTDEQIAEDIRRWKAKFIASTFTD